MRTFDNYGRNDTVPFQDGDNRWQGIDMTRDRPLVQAGMLSLGENTRLRTGQVRQRTGTTIAPDFNLTAGFSNIIVGSGVYRNPNSDEVLVIAPALEKYAWVMQDGKDPFQVNYNTAETASVRTNGNQFIEFTQAFDKLLMHRISMPAGGKILVWNGVTDQTVDANRWTPLTKPAGAYAEVGPYWNGEPFMDRVIYYYWHWPTIPGRDEWIISDTMEYGGFDNVFQTTRTNAAESDYITRIMAYFRGAVIIFKNQSIHQANIAYDNNLLRVVVQQRVLNNDLGSIGNHMPLLIGEDVLFLSKPNGFYRLREIIQEQTVALALPFSEPIQRVIDNINWAWTDIYGCSVALDNYAFFGVAVGGDATRLNTILVFNTQSNQWESAGDTWADPGFGFNRLHVTNYGGVHRIFAIDRDNAIVYLLYEGITDDLRSGTFSVPFKCETRGYVGDDPIGFKQFGRVNVAISTSDPNVTITALVDGYNEEKELTTITKNRLAYYPHGHAPFNVLTDDPDAPKRESYGIVDTDNFAIEDFEDLPLGPIAFLPPTSPPVAGPLQESLERNTVRQSGRWCSLRIENTEGVCDLLAVSIEGARSSNTVRTAA